MPSKAGIAFVGPIGSGKTTTAAWYIKYFHAVRLSFADPLKIEIADALADTPEQAWQYLLEMKDPVMKAQWRTIMQWWGTEFRRNRFGENYWVDKAMEQVKNDVTGQFWVSDDCRFMNEYEVLKKEGFKFARLLPEKEVPSSHASEDEWKLFDVDLEVPWEDLQQRIEKINLFIWGD